MPLASVRPSRIIQHSLTSTPISVVSDAVLQGFESLLLWVYCWGEQSTQLVRKVLSIAFQFSRLKMKQEILAGARNSF